MSFIVVSLNTIGPGGGGSIGSGSQPIKDNAKKEISKKLKNFMQKFKSTEIMNR